MSIDLSQLEDVSLRTEAESLGITIPHPESVLDAKLETLAPQLYYRLLVLEAYTYDHSQRVDRTYSDPDALGPHPPPEDYPDLEPNTAPGGGWYYEFPVTVSQYQPFWTAYNDTILGYLNASPLSKAELKDFIFALYTYIAVYLGRGFGSQARIDAANAKDIFNVNQFIDTALAFTIDHYDDYQYPPPPVSDGVEGPIVVDNGGKGSCAALTADGAHIAAAYGIDSAIVPALTDEYTDAVSDATLQLIFSNPEPPDPDADWNPTVAWDTIFDELNWKWYVDYWNAPLDVPERPDPIELPTD